MRYYQFLLGIQSVLRLTAQVHMDFAKTPLQNVLLSMKGWILADNDQLPLSQQPMGKSFFLVEMVDMDEVWKLITGMDL